MEASLSVIEGAWADRGRGTGGAMGREPRVTDGTI